MLYFNISPLKRQQKPPLFRGGRICRAAMRPRFQKTRRPLRKLLWADGAPRHSVSCSAGTAPDRPTSAISSRLTTASIFSSSAHLSAGKRLWMRAQTSST